MGIPLHRNKDIRLLYGEDPWDSRPIDFDNLLDRPVPRGHVIAARITSENPDEVRSRDANIVRHSLVTFSSIHVYCFICVLYTSASLVIDIT